MRATLSKSPKSHRDSYRPFSPLSRHCPGPFRSVLSTPFVLPSVPSATLPHLPYLAASLLGSATLPHLSARTHPIPCRPTPPLHPTRPISPYLNPPPPQRNPTQPNSPTPPQRTATLTFCLRKLFTISMMRRVYVLRGSPFGMRSSSDVSRALNSSRSCSCSTMACIWGQWVARTPQQRIPQQRIPQQRILQQRITQSLALRVTFSTMWRGGLLLRVHEREQVEGG